MCQDNIQNENSLWEKRHSPRPDSGGVMWRDLGLDLGSLVLPFFAPFTQYIIITRHDTHPRLIPDKVLFHLKRAQLLIIIFGFTKNDMFNFTIQSLYCRVPPTVTYF